jgi:hypothetical protein
VPWTDSDSWAKWRRAKGHLKDLGDKLQAASEQETPFGWSKRYTACPEAQPDGLAYRLYVDAEEIDTQPWSLIAGDCVFNLRAAPDHRVYEMHWRRYGDRITKEAEEASAFPILSTKPDGKRGRPADYARWNEIKRLSVRERRAIAWLQPYIRRNDELRDIRRNLEQIATLDNIDKHRHLNVLQAAPLMASVAWFGDPPAYGFRQESFLEQPLVGKTEVMRWTFDVPPPNTTGYLHGNYAVRAYICLFEGGKPAQLLLRVLQDAVDATQAVLWRLDKFLP